ncbi:MAG: site-specific DNA-methyltransferase [Oscillospiraceae bacterium]|nr:site-specific DNA-methyltransferase [Oscillospiraceae bacterium]
MEKLKMQTANKADENFKKLAEMFPNAVTEAKDENGNTVRAIDKDVLMQEINTKVVEGREERYQFTWPDKKKSVLLANAPINKTLRPCREESVDFDNTENLYIEGDNLEVLKLLQETYLGKIKLIYIDPPYNTGKDFVYADDFAQGTEEYLENSGQFDEEGNRLVQNTESNGRFHTDWLNMMYARLKIAKDLLTDDGSIFVSIDYNEFSNLKKIMDEIFGEENFQREIIWRIGWLSGYKTTVPNFIRNHDTILFYSKNHNNMYFEKKYIENKDFKPLVKKDAKVVGKLKELGLDDVRINELLQFINHENRPEKYPIEDTWNSNEYDDLNSIAIVSFSGEKISKVLNIPQDFKGQKSIKMLQRIIEATTKDGDIVMDFFSGTSSTAQAVLNTNISDDKKRSFIMVQVPEKTEKNSAAYKGGYFTICDIAKERIKKNGEKYLLESQNLDVGFRVLKCDTSNMKDVYYSPADYEQSLFSKLEDNIKEDRTPEDLLFQVMLDLGVLLSSKIEETTVDGKKVFNVADGYLIACFDENVSDETIKAIAKQKPYYFVMRDSSMASDSVATNFEQIFAAYSPDTVRKVL